MIIEIFWYSLCYTNTKATKIDENLTNKARTISFKVRFQTIGNYLRQSIWVLVNRHVLSANT